MPGPLSGGVSGSGDVVGPASSTASTLVAFDGTSGKLLKSGLVILSGPTATRTITVPDANFTAARTDAAQTFTGTQGMSVIAIGNGTIDGSQYSGSRLLIGGYSLLQVVNDSYLDVTSVSQLTVRNLAEFTQVADGGTPSANSARIFAKEVSGTAHLLGLTEGGIAYNIGGAIFSHYTSVTSTSTNGTEDDLLSNTTLANTLSADGQSITQIEHVQFVSSATAARRLKKYFAGTSIFDSGALTLTLGGDFIVETTIIRESATVVRCSVSVVTTSASSVPYATYTSITGLTLSSTNILKTTGIASGTGAASGDIINLHEKTYWSAAA